MFKSHAKDENTAPVNENMEQSEYIEQIDLLEKKLLLVQKKEHTAKTTLLTSQLKWTNFSREILVIAKELMGVVESGQSISNINQHVYKSMKDKISRYD